MSDIAISKRRRPKRETRPEIDRRTSAPFNGETADRTVPDPYSTTGGKIVATAPLRLYAASHVVAMTCSHRGGPP